MCDLMHSNADMCKVAIPPPRGGHRTLVDVPAYTEDERRILFDDFRKRLDRIVSWAEALGALPVLVLPAANDAGFEPNRSYLGPETRYAERARVAEEFLSIRAEEDRDPLSSINRYRELLSRHPSFAEAHYRLGVRLDAKGEDEEAYQHFVLARDLDGFPMRMPSDFQQAYRDVAKKHRSILVDGQALFHMIGRDGQLDESYFLDAMHPTLRGQAALARSILQGLRAAHAFGWPESVPAPRVDPADLVKEYHLGSAHGPKYATG